MCFLIELPAPEFEEVGKIMKRELSTVPGCEE
jgi:hypothetical protein